MADIGWRNLFHDPTLHPHSDQERREEATLCNRYRDHELTCDPEGEEHVIDEGDLLSCAIEGKSEQIVRFLAPRCGDLMHWWPRIFPSALANAEVRAWIDSLGINILSLRIRNFYNE